jgi:hypothetical protein
VTDVFSDPRFVSWAQRMRLYLVPKMESSGSVAFLMGPGGDVDIEQALQLGLCILMGKPLIVVVTDGREVPAKLRAIADHIVEGDLADETTRAAMNAAIEAVAEKETDQ